MTGNSERGRAGQAQGQLDIALAPLRARLMTHPLYACLRDEQSIRVFMEAHVFAVWDFQSLLKALQRLLTCVEVPWIPTPDPEARRLVNEIILDEESDHAPAGGYLSHFEIYLQAMRECGADTGPIQSFVSSVSAGTAVEEALDPLTLPPGIRSFVRTTMAIARSGQPHRVASAIAFGREEIIPAMFRQLVDRLVAVSPHSWSTFRYYLERHIGKDSEQHGPQTYMLVHRLCGSDRTLWLQAVNTTKTSLEARIRLWDRIAANVAGRRTGQPGT